MDCEGGVETDPICRVTQQTGTDAMERAGPRQGVGHDHGASPHDLRRNSLHTPGQLGRRSSRERQQEDSARIHAADDQVGYPMRQCVGLARAGTGDHEQGPGTALASNAMLYCLALG